jgi:hypothetical protein
MSTTQARKRGKESDWLEVAGRAGLATRGILYFSVGILALQIAFGGSGERADRTGALEAVARQPAGQLLLALLVVGMAGYATWQLALAAIDPAGRGTDAEGVAKRLGNVGRAGIYAAGIATALPLALGHHADGGSKEQDWTARALGLPGGRWLVAALGLAVIGAGLWNGWKGVSGKWRKQLDTSEMSATEKQWAEPIAIGGLIGRMLVFGLVGSFLVRAALRYDAHKGVGLDAALKEVRGKAYGPYALVVFAAALVLFGVYSMLQARWRRVTPG